MNTGNNYIIAKYIGGVFQEIIGRFEKFEEAMYHLNFITENIFSMKEKGYGNISEIKRINKRLTFTDKIVFTYIIKNKDDKT